MPSASQSISHYQPLPRSIGSLGRVHHPMKAPCRVHYISTSRSPIGDLAPMHAPPRGAQAGLNTTGYARTLLTSSTINQPRRPELFTSQVNCSRPSALALRAPATPDVGVHSWTGHGLVGTDMFTHSPTHPLTHSLTHPLTHSTFLIWQLTHLAGELSCAAVSRSSY